MIYKCTLSKKMNHSKIYDEFILNYLDISPNDIMNKYCTLEKNGTIEKNGSYIILIQNIKKLKLKFKLFSNLKINYKMN